MDRELEKVKNTILISVNTSWNLINFRKGLIEILKKDGYKVIAIAPLDKYSPEVSRLVDKYEDIRIDNKGKNPFKDIFLLFNYIRIFYFYKPDIFLGYTIKPNIYGSIASHLLGIKVVNNIAGLGITFTENNFLNKLVRFLYRMALSRSSKIFFQNLEDKEIFYKNIINKNIETDVLPGSGVNLNHFQKAQMPKNKNFKFLLISRMLWNKGIGEFVKAARILSKEYKNIEFCLLGFTDIQNPLCINKKTIDEWVAEGVINYLGETDDVREEIREADCVVLPSYYREGTPKSLLEAASMGRPIITTDNVGCRDVVDDNINGFLCEPRNEHDLAEKMKKMINMTSKEIIEMGKHSRKKAENQFDEEIVKYKYIECIRKLNNDSV